HTSVKHTHACREHTHKGEKHTHTHTHTSLKHTHTHTQTGLEQTHTGLKHTHTHTHTHTPTHIVFHMDCTQCLLLSRDIIGTLLLFTLGLKTNVVSLSSSAERMSLCVQY